MKETSDDEGLSLSKGEEGRYCTGQEYGMLEAELS